MRFVKFFLVGLFTLTFTAAMAQNEGAEGGFQFEEEKPLGAEGASGTEGALSPEGTFGSEGIIRADGAANGSEGSNRTDGGTIGSGEMIRSNGGTTLGNDDRIFVTPPPGDGGGDPGGNPGGGLDPGTGQPNPDPGDAGAVPVDGGLALLLIAGAGYGSKKAYDFRKSQKAKVKSDK